VADRGIGSSLEHLTPAVCERGNSERPQKRTCLAQRTSTTGILHGPRELTFEDFALVHRERIYREPPEGLRNNQLRWRYLRRQEVGDHKVYTRLTCDAADDCAQFLR